MLEIDRTFNRVTASRLPDHPGFINLVIENTVEGRTSLLEFMLTDDAADKILTVLHMVLHGDVPSASLSQGATA